MAVRKRSIFLLGALLTAAAVCFRPGGQLTARPPEDNGGPVKPVLVIHGGAGAMPKTKMTAAVRKKYHDELTRALRAGHEALQKGTSVDAVEAAIKVMEDSPLFNAGKGAVFTHEGRNELDAAIMEGRDKKAGAVAGLTRIKNPISAARAVMEQSEHVMLVGDGADRFAISKGLTEVSPVYFWTEERWKQLQRALEKEKAAPKQGKTGQAQALPADRHFGTVGAVALDRHGNLAAGTSTGGLTNKRHGRVGDSPVIGAGTYADNQSCAVSATGHGEVFIRFAVAHDIAARMKYQKLAVGDAAEQVLKELPDEKGGVGGVIALDARGHHAMSFNTEGMYRGFITSDGRAQVAIYEDFEK
jgi:beta-aspartyl-peptidase (threonine type)